MKTLVAVMTLLPSVVFAAGSELTERIRAEAQRCADALVAGDYAMLVSLTHPRIVSEMGGTEKAIAAVTQGIVELKADGVVMESVVIQTPQDPIASGAVVAVLVPQVTTFNTPKGRFRQIGHLLAVSEDGGSHWSFIDTGTLKPAELQAYFPALAAQIKLPPTTPPVPVEN